MSDRAKPCPTCKETPNEVCDVIGWKLYCCGFSAQDRFYRAAVENWNKKVAMVSVKRTVRVKPLEWEQMQDGAGVLQNVYSAWCPLFVKRFWAEGKDKIAGVETKRAARIMNEIEVIDDC
jgi:hypothetical protein